MASTTRRGFLGTGSAAGIGYFVAAGSRPAWSNSAIEQMNVASIGVGGKGGSDSENAAQFGNSTRSIQTSRRRRGSAPVAAVRASVA